MRLPKRRRSRSARALGRDGDGLRRSRAPDLEDLCGTSTTPPVMRVAVDDQARQVLAQVERVGARRSGRATDGVSV